MDFKNYKLLRIFVNEHQRYEHISLHEWIVKKAMEEDILSAIAFRGLEGYGTDKKFHSTKILTLAIELPVIIEIIGVEDKIEKLIKIIDGIIGEGILTVEDVKAKFYIPKD